MKVIATAMVPTLALVGTAFAASNDYADIQTKSAHLTPAQQSDAQQIFATAFKLVQSGDNDAAATAFEKGLSIDSANPAANYYYGSVLEHLGQNDKALKHYKIAAALGGTAPEKFKAEAAIKKIGANRSASESRESVINRVSLGVQAKALGIEGKWVMSDMPAEDGKACAWYGMRIRVDADTIVHSMDVGPYNANYFEQRLKIVSVSARTVRLRLKNGFIDWHVLDATYVETFANGKPRYYSRCPDY